MVGNSRQNPLSESEYKAALESARLVQDSELATGVAILKLGHDYHLQGRENEAEDWLRQTHPLLVVSQRDAYIP